MNAYTLTLYTIASGLCFCLSLVLLVFAQIRRGTFLVRSSALGLVVLATGFLGAGIGHLMPFWFTVIGMNAVLLSAGLFFYSGVRAFVTQKTPHFDWFGACLIALAMPFFFYWGFVEPNGLYRSGIFSLVAALIQGRTAWLLVPRLRQAAFKAPLFFITLVFVVVSIWMAVRGVLVVWATPMAPEVKAANPTTWPTVFAFNVLLSVFVASLLATEVQAQKKHEQNQEVVGEGEAVRGNLHMLWGIVAVVLVAILSETGIAYLVLYQREQQQIKEQNSLTNQALVEHAQQLFAQTDMVLRATRDLAQKGYPAQSLSQFVDTLRVRPSIFEGIELIDAQGRSVLLPSDLKQAQAERQNDSFQHHQNHALDGLYVSPVVVDQARGTAHFSVSRRVSDAQGHFAGVVRVSLDSATLSHYYAQLMTGADSVAALLGAEDHRIRARWPTPSSAQLQAPLVSPLWDMHSAESGTFGASSMVDGVGRQYAYRRLQGLPLYMVTGFSDADIHRNTLQNIKPIALGAVLAIAVVLAMALMLAAALRRRDEQDRFLSMISHELRTPLSVIRMVAGGSAMPEATKGRVVRAVNDMSAIVDSALQADRLRHGRVRAHVTDCNLNELLHSICQNTAESERIQMDEAPFATLQTDPQLLNVVLSNLLVNALKYSPAGSTVQLQAVATEHQRKSGISITVSNQVGPVGAPDARQVFRKFYRAPAARGKTGSGLGLHIADGMARLLGGHIEFLTQEGTVQFALWIPL